MLVAALAVALAVVAAVVLLAEEGDQPERAEAGRRAERGRPSTTGAAPASTTAAARSTSRTASTSRADPPGPCPDPRAAISAWPMRRRLAALVVVGVDPSSAAEATEAVEDHHVGGLFVGGDDTRLLAGGALQDLRAASPTGLVVAIDEEGGRVQRLERLDGEVPSAREMAGSLSPAEVTALARRRARVMRAHGVTVDLAPVVDVSAQADDTVIGDRSWSDDPAEVVAYAGAYADGLLAEGVTPVLKHFPGHGSASGDTHEGAATTPPLDVLRGRDLVPYAELLPRLGPRVAVMLGHLDVPGLTEAGTPSSLSPATVSLLRDEYRFGGVVMTDDLSAMEAVTARFGVGEAAVRALAAGVDMVLLSSTDVDGLLDHLEAAVAAGDLGENGVDTAVARTLALKGLDACGVHL